ncbi:piggyBac transposable element-derived protein 3-like [Photinus pyralis]|uniref:piggyBac transposable element-derived protein 3-like n=1 Tax=Photinus pyralis TaxID=7054 RepID=UPI0012672D62|nr:piggyBac transposable element-derived protein 3-like [Photinus pyralis]
MDGIPARTFYGGPTVASYYRQRDIPNESEDSELSDDDISEPTTAPQVTTVSDTTSDEEDNVPLSHLRNSTTTKKKPKNPIKWKPSSTKRNVTTNQFTGDELLPGNILTLNTPLKLFSHFISDDFLVEVVRQTCLYSVQTNPAKPITTCPEEIQNFIGILLWMSLIRQPTSRRYWSPKTRIPQVADVMPVNRFEQIKRYIHFSDNSNNAKGIDKIQPVITQIRNACLKIPLEENLSCDEQVISFKGRSRYKTYNPKKPHKWGYKMWVLSGISGISYNFELFSGKGDNTHTANEPDLGAASNVVIRMSKIVPHNEHYKLYYDNYFSSLELVSHLSKRNIHSVATVRSNRLKNSKMMQEKEMKRKGRGSIQEQTATVDGIDIHAIQWYDNKIVSLISDYCGTEPTVKVKRFFRSEQTRKDIQCPDIVKEYNRHMGGVDLLDSLLGLYPIKLKSKKWYHRIFYHLIDVAVVNSWLVDRRIKKQLGKTEDVVPLLVFKTLAEQLCAQKNIVTKHKRAGRPRSSSPQCLPKRRCLEARPSSYIQEDRTDHWPSWTTNRERCKRRTCKGKSRVVCVKCKIHLCFHPNKNCFKEFHVDV